jgi:hypothetical protein
MKEGNLNRRDFSKLTFAAFGGVLAGSMLGRRPLLASDKEAAKDLHACCGLNSCKGEGQGAGNNCAGMGHCATVQKHGCAGTNACKGQGAEATNSCKGKGSCAVPVKGEAWKKARANYEAAMTKAGKSFGPAPKECGAS